MKRNTISRSAITLTCVAAGAIAISLYSPMASAQVLYGSIVGTVTDQSGAVVPKAAVRVTNTSTGLTREVTTDTSGYYSIPNLLQGTYDVSIA
ncbi:MAG: carboxypeptidase regulatory-like domain-containing protein, partial [Bryobacteraceae bacterium]|nr:carboxypeptidase regulatory-like domain-containing protein [Bryobacteraceae bacterium]